MKCRVFFERPAPPHGVELRTLWCCDITEDGETTEARLLNVDSLRSCVVRFINKASVPASHICEVVQGDALCITVYYHYDP